MLIGFFLDNRRLGRTDFSRPWEGNPGSGAAEYLHAATPYFISKHCGHKAECMIFSPHVEYLPSSIEARQAGSVVDAARQAKARGVDFFVFRPRMNEELHILDVIDELALPSIGRAALTPNPAHIRRMAKSSAFKALVCVGKEQYDFLMDSPVHDKIVHIDNGVHVASCSPGALTYKDSRLVVYLGALVPQKGFQILAAAWPEILKRVQDARLSVIGSAKIYDEDAKLGPLGVAEERFERDFLLPHLADAAGKVHPSINFHGQLGREKYQILRKALNRCREPLWHNRDVLR